MPQKPLAGPIKSRFWASFVLCAACCGAILLPLAILDLTQGDFFHYAGDFNGQQISFYQYMNSFIKQGGTYSWATDLGSGAMNSYSFYLYGSPFFWLSLLLPASVLPYAMVPLLMLKFGVAGGGAYLYLARYCKNKNHAILGAVLYALSGFGIYNIFFNHFIDVLATFPFLLWALDEAMLNRRRGVFAVAVAVNLLNNYFFFAGQALFLIIYFGWKLASREYRLTLHRFWVMAVETVLGCAMGFVLIWPAFLSLLENPRTISLSSGWGFLTYGKVQQYLAILVSWILPPDCPYMPSIWSEGVEKWTSMTAWLPLVSLSGVIAYFRARKGTAAKGIVATCAVMALIPICNSAFYMLNSSYYARWYYMPLLLMAGMTVQSLEAPDIDIRAGAVTLLKLMPCMLVFALVPVQDASDKTWSLGVLKQPGQYWFVLLFGYAGVLFFWWLLKYYRDKRGFFRRTAAAVCVSACLFGLVHIAIGKMAQWEGDRDLCDQYTTLKQLGQDLPEGFYRLNAYEMHDNTALWTGRSTLQCFNSTVAPSILAFYPKVGVTRDVRTKPDEGLYALRDLLSVKYTILTPEKEESWLENMTGSWHYYDTLDGFVIYENEAYIPMGMTYSHYVTEKTLESIGASRRANVLLRAVCLTEEQAEAYAETLHLTELTSKDLNNLTPDAALQDAALRTATGCTEFIPDNYGFSAAVTLTDATLVFFSMPYEKGLTATVNDQPAEVLCVSYGLTAVVCPAGPCSIRVDYQPEGYGLSSKITLGGLVLFALYLAAFALNRKRRQSKIVRRTALTEGPEAEPVPPPALPEENALHTDLTPCDRAEQPADSPLAAEGDESSQKNS